MVDLVQCKRKHINGFMLLLCCTLKCFPMHRALEKNPSLFFALFSAHSMRNPLIQLKQCKKHWSYREKHIGFRRWKNWISNAKKWFHFVEVESKNDCLIATSHINQSPKHVHAHFQDGINHRTLSIFTFRSNKQFRDEYVWRDLYICS